MILFNNYLDTLVILFIYMFIYNISLIMIFWTLHQFISFNFKTIYSFTDLKFNYYFTTILSIVLFSMAGVTPFLGFFSKILILILLINSNFFLFYIFFFGLLFFGLYSISLSLSKFNTGTSLKLVFETLSHFLIINHLSTCVMTLYFKYCCFSSKSDWKNLHRIRPSIFLNIL